MVEAEEDEQVGSKNKNYSNLDGENIASGVYIGNGTQ